MDRHIKQNLTGQSHSEWDMPSKPFLTIGEVANLLQVSNRTVYNLIYNYIKKILLSALYPDHG